MPYTVGEKGTIFRLTSLFFVHVADAPPVQYTHAYQVAAYSTIVRGKGTMFWLAFIFFVLVADEPPVQHEYAQQYMPQ